MSCRPAGGSALPHQGWREGRGCHLLPGPEQPMPQLSSNEIRVGFTSWLWEPVFHPLAFLHLPAHILPHCPHSWLTDLQTTDKTWEVLDKIVGKPYVSLSKYLVGLSVQAWQRLLAHGMQNEDYFLQCGKGMRHARQSEPPRHAECCW